jgi:hypothetical protein
MEAKSVIERAYELAVSGACPGVQDVRAALRAEGYGTEVDRHFASPTLKSALRKVCTAASRATEAAKVEAALRQLAAIRRDDDRA